MTGENRCVHIDRFSLELLTSIPVALIWLILSKHFARSAAFVIAFLMKSRGWRLAQSFQWVKERRPQVHLSDGNFITYACLFWYLCSQKLLKGGRERVRERERDWYASWVCTYLQLATCLHACVCELQSKMATSHVHTRRHINAVQDITIFWNIEFILWVWSDVIAIIALDDTVGFLAWLEISIYGGIKHFYGKL